MSANITSEQNTENKKTIISATNHDNIHQAFYRIIIILALFSILGAPLFLIPRHNTMFYQEYWFENIIITLYLILFSTADLLLNCYVYLKERSLASWKLFLYLWSWTSTCFTIVFLLCYTIWVLYLGKNHPMPFIGLCQFPSWIAMLCGIWFIFPRELLSKEDFRKKLKTYVIFSMWWFFMDIQKDILTIIFENLPVYIEWIFGFIVLTIREMNKKVLTSFVKKMAGDNDEQGTVLLGMHVSCHYAFFIAVTLSGSHISKIICMMLIDFALHLKMTFDLIKLQRKTFIVEIAIENQRIIQNNMLLRLAIVELCEGAIPLAYAIAFSMMYYGPNFALLGGSIEEGALAKDVVKIYGLMLSMFLIDLLSVVQNAYLLYRFCKIKITQEFFRILDKYWYFLLMGWIVNVLTFMTLKDINWGMDWSFNFVWVTNEGRIMLINNSTNLSEIEKTKLLSYST